MPRNQELDRIKSEEQVAFQRKQSAWNAYSEAKEYASSAHDAMQSAWEERSRARDELNHEYEVMQSASENYHRVWDEYSRIRDYNNSRIDSLRNEADYEHQEMKRCFDQASNEYEYGNKSMASTYSQEGHSHKDRRDELNAEISELCREIKEAKQSAEWQAPKTDNSAFKAAKASFERAKSRHESAEAEFKRLKLERDRLKADFDSAQAEHKRLKEEFQRKLEEIKAQKTLSRQKTVEKVSMALAKERGPFSLGTIFGQDAKIVPRNDGSGKTDVYFAGMAAAGDGLGHGHAIIDRNGSVTYLRDAWQDHDDYLIDNAGRRGINTHRI
ncbi:DUF1771 domain-containing protein [Candidatus Saccharibacteria bacterium]|nr:DUF1771 domain-containing protein [Candidatus Saccharibacteria bacterium]